MRVSLKWSFRIALPHLLAFLIVASNNLEVSAQAKVPDALHDLPMGWVIRNWGEIEAARQQIALAYELNPDQLIAFDEIFYPAWSAQYYNDQQFYRSVRLDEDPVEAARKRNEWAEHAPVRPFALVQMIESILPSGDYTEAHHRYTELRNRQYYHNWLGTETVQYQNNFLQMVQRIRSVSNSPINLADGRPAPRSELEKEQQRQANLPRLGAPLDKPETIAPAENLRRLSSSAFVRFVPRERPIVAGINAGLAKPKPDSETFICPEPADPNDPRTALLIDACEDPWQAEILSIISEFAVTRGVPDAKIDPVNTPFGAIDDIYARAAVYRRSRCEEYAALESIESRAEFTERLAELDRPLSAMLVELRQRLSAMAAQTN